MLDRLKRRAHQKRQVSPLTPARMIAGSFFLVILTGTILLMLPFAASGTPLTFTKALFTATSATCVTGLTLIDPAIHLSLFGQIVLLCLIEIGGIGLISISSFFMLTFSRKWGFRSVKLAAEHANATSLHTVRPLIRSVIATTVSIELVGACFLCLTFIPQYGAKGIWISIFTAISSFCNAGFDLFGFEGAFGSLTGHSEDYILLLTCMMMIILGGLGFMVIREILGFRKNRRFSFHTKVMLLGTAILLVSGTVSLLLVEYNNPDTLGNMSFFKKLMHAGFLSVTARTAGFANIDLNALSVVSKCIMCFLMFIGAGPASTGGGIKITSFAVLLITVLSIMTGREDIRTRRHRIDKGAVYKAITIFFLAAGIVLTTTAIILFTSEHISAINALFESVSAFATVGLTADTTLHLSTVSQYAIIFTMFFGRVGPISFALAMTIRGHNQKVQKMLPEGKLIVG